MEFKDLGVAISALVAAISYWVKNRHERRRATRTALYHLLELHHLVHRLLPVAKAGPQPLIAQIRSVGEAHGKPLVGIDSEEPFKAMRIVIQMMIRSHLNELGSETREPFAKALAELSKEDPILAFKLRGQDRLLTLSQNIQTMADKLSPESSTQTQSPGLGIDLFILKEAASNLNYSLKITAWRCDFFTFGLVMLRIRRVAREKPGDLEEFYKEWVELVMSEMESAPVAKIAPLA